MGNDALVLWLSPELALAYLVTVVVGVAGVLQLIATHGARPDLAWLPPRAATPVGVGLILIPSLLFYLVGYRLIFVPGPAGLELMMLYAGGAVLAIWLTRLLHHLARGR